MNILVWNVRGASRRSLKTDLSLLVHSHKPDLIILTETRTANPLSSNSFKYLNFLYSAYSIIPGTGHGGGIWCLWQPSFFNLSSTYYHANNQAISIVGSLVHNHHLQVVFSAIYASPRCQYYFFLCSKLLHFQQLHVSHSAPWLLVGDFNYIINIHENFGGASDPYNALYPSFSQFILDASLTDLGFRGPSFT